MTFTKQLQEAEELAGKLSIVHVFLSGSATRFTRHAQTFCLLCTLKRIQVQNAGTMGKIEKIGSLLLVSGYGHTDLVSCLNTVEVSNVELG